VCLILFSLAFFVPAAIAACLLKINNPKKTQQKERGGGKTGKEVFFLFLKKSTEKQNRGRG